MCSNSAHRMDGVRAEIGIHLLLIAHLECYCKGSLQSCMQFNTPERQVLHMLMHLGQPTADVCLAGMHARRDRC
jgi:hypothetical protein